jgi:hypothetical protein
MVQTTESQELVLAVVTHHFELGSDGTNSPQP